MCPLCESALSTDRELTRGVCDTCGVIIKRTILHDLDLVNEQLANLQEQRTVLEDALQRVGCKHPI